MHITTVHHPLDTRIYYKQCMSLKNNNFEVIYLTKDTDKDIKEKIKQDGVHHIVLKTFNNRFLRILISSFKAIKRAKSERCLIYQIHDPELLIPALLLFNKNENVIYDIHEDYYTSILQKKYIPKLLRFFLAKCLKMIERLAEKNFSLIIAEKYYAERFPKALEILNYPLTKSQEIKEEHNISNDTTELSLIYTGNVTEDRGALIHAKIPQLINKSKVYFVGRCAYSVKEKIDEIDLVNGTIIDGVEEYLPREYIDRYYQKNVWLAGLAIFPHTEHYAQKELTKFFEYMSYGIPIICSDFPVWKKFVDKYQCGVAINIENPDDIEKISELLRDRDRIKKMGENGMKAINDSLNWSIEEKKLINLYNQLSIEKRTRK